MINYLIVFLISMVPLIELRGAIPYAVANNMPLLQSYIIAILGNMIPMPIIFFFARRVLEWGNIKQVLVKLFAFLHSVLKRATRVVRSLRKRQEMVFM